VQRAVDYVATRKDLNLDKLGYCGVSTVGFWGTIHAAIEPRIKVMLFIAGGFLPRRLPAEIEAVNYAPRVKVPALMLNGRYDSLFGVETSQLPLFNLLGTPAKDKRHILCESGHIPPRQDRIRESLAWLDKYLGPVD
jgi:cephalosporin-C deacetylase-like acetyl esterase